jgi:hypothetical protein
MKTLMLVLALTLSSQVLAEMTNEDFLEIITEQSIHARNGLMSNGSPPEEAAYLGIYSAIQWVIVTHERFEKESPFCNNLYNIGGGGSANRTVVKDMYPHAVRHVLAVKLLVTEYLDWRPRDFEIAEQQMREITAAAPCSSI